MLLSRAIWRVVLALPGAAAVSSGEDAGACSFLVRVARVARRWDAWETNRLLPEELRRPVVRPLLHREGLDGLQRLLTDELARLDGGRCG